MTTPKLNFRFPVSIAISKIHDHPILKFNSSGSLDEANDNTSRAFFIYLTNVEESSNVGRCSGLGREKPSF